MNNESRNYLMVAIVIAILAVVFAYPIGLHQGKSETSRFTTVPNVNAGFMFDHKTAQLCSADTQMQTHLILECRTVKIFGERQLRSSTFAIRRY